MNTKKHWLLASIVSASLVGCISEDCGSECDFPTTAFTEIATLGATITTRGVPVAESVDETYYEGAEPFVTARMKLYFSPAPEQETYEFNVREDGIADRVAKTNQYEYTFSYQDADQFIIIEPDSTEFDPPGPANQYSSAVRLESYDEELIVNGNHLVSTALGDWFAAPARATHVELWFREMPESNRELVRRVPLTSFDFWTRYLEPLISSTTED